MKKRLFISILFAGFFSAFIYNEGAAQASFTVRTDFSTGSAPSSVASADFNGDGKLDIVSACNFGNKISVYRNNTSPGSSTPSFIGRTDFPTQSFPTCVATGDLNSDGKPDIVSADRFGSGITTFINKTPAGGTSLDFEITNFSTGSNPVFVCINDMNGDGKQDIIICHSGSNLFSIALSSTSPGALTPTFFGSANFGTNSSPFYLSIADFNGDGKLDVAAANFSSENISVHMNTTLTGATTASFSAGVSFTTGIQPRYISAGDINGDGKPDLATANEISNTLSIFINTTSTGASSPSFSPKSDIASGNNNTNSVLLKDINCDGKPDLLVINIGFTIFLNITSPGASTPAFHTGENIVTGGSPGSISCEDFNGDGKSDLAEANRAENSFSVFLNIMGLGNEPAVFSSLINFSTATSPRTSAVSDFNGDGKQDVSVTNQGSTSVSVFLNTTSPGAATPTLSARTDFTTGNTPVNVVSGDINGDGKPDLIVTNFSDTTVSIMLNTTAPGASTPAFTAKTDFTTGSGPIGVTLKDINKDGKPDLLIANYTSASVSVLLNTTTPGAAIPTFASKTDFTSSIGTVSIQAADLNGDGMHDLVSSNYDNNTIAVFFNITSAGASTPAFTAKTEFITDLQPHSTAITDLNGDGKPDIITANNFSNSLSVFFNTTVTGASTPTLSARTDLTTGNSPHGVSAADLNGDGKFDLISANKTSNSISVFLNTTSTGSSVPAFSARTDFATGLDPYYATIGDMNGDGKPDLIIPCSSSSFISVLMNDIQLPLPVELASFTSSVEHQNVNLNWTTLQEQNNSGFEVERNSFGTCWSKIGFVNGAGTTNQFRNYSYRDVNLSSGNYSYRLKQIDYNGNFKYYELSNEVIVGIPSKFSLRQNYPNPFNPVTKINYELPAAGLVSLKIYDISGREVSQLVNQIQQAGYYSLSFNAAGLSSGVYFYQLSSNNFSEVKKMMIVK